MSDLLLNIQDFHFLRPQWLWAILPLIALTVLLAYFTKQQSGWQSVLAGHLYKHLMSETGAKKHKRPFGLLGVVWLITTLALAGPTWQQLPQPVYQLHSGNVVVLDMSLSMRATDITPNRLTRAKYKAIDLVKKLTEGETGLVVYSGDAFTISPLSSDGQNLTTLIPSLSPEIMPVPGSDPLLGLQTAVELLKNANYQQGDIFWVTDGVENQQMKEISELLNDSAYRLSVLAVGTEEGAPVKMVNGELLKDVGGAIVIPKLPVSNLTTLAKQGGGRYAPMQSDDSDIEYLVSQTQLSANEDGPGDDARNNDSFGDKWQEMGPYLLLILLPLAAYGFRRGLFAVFLCALLLPAYSPKADAGLWQDMWQTKDQQALEAYQQQQYDIAAEQFEEPLWQGSALYKDKDYEKALEAFNRSNTLDARFNQANTLAQLGQYDKAIERYDSVLAEEPDNQDAQSNKSLVEKLLAQQKEKEQEQEQQQNDQSQQQEEQPQQDSDSTDNKDDEQKSDSAGQQEQEQQSDKKGSQSEDSESSQDEKQDGDSDENKQQPDEQQNESSTSDNQPSSQDDQQESDNYPDQEQQPNNDDPKKQESEGQQSSAEAQPAPELTEEEKEQMQRMQTLLNRVPDDPAFLLKRKMQIEAQQRKRQRVPSNLQRNW